eukprot:TRINITY_DN32170_c0_g1_i1.p2 TRINITY_DN32170_c0_g1~~TRINITY_DN32170_c0_g1_i1.p2  ORF type:complete len:113 (+),score=12.33 TRINITY_DN32170_c0_g1_i1:383-721(+)
MGSRRRRYPMYRTRRVITQIIITTTTLITVVFLCSYLQTHRGQKASGSFPTCSSPHRDWDDNIETVTVAWRNVLDVQFSFQMLRRRIDDSWIWTYALTPDIVMVTRHESEAD